MIAFYPLMKRSNIDFAIVTLNRSAIGQSTCLCHVWAVLFMVNSFQGNVERLKAFSEFLMNSCFQHKVLQHEFLQ